MRKRNPARVLGPFKERGRRRLIVVEEGGRRSVFFPTHAVPQGSAVATARVLGMIGGELSRDSQNVHERLKQFDDNTLARLLELLESEKKSGPPN